MIIVWHICAIGSFQPVVDRQLKLIKDICFNRHVSLYINVVGPGLVVLPDDFRILVTDRFDNKDPEVFEIPSINLVKVLSDLQGEDTPLLYLNTRGVSHSGQRRYYIDKWSDILEYFCLTHYDSCLEKLQEDYDVVSSLYFQKPLPHISGNMWWSHTKYIKKLPYLTPETSIYKKFKPKLEGKEQEIGIARHDCEFWIMRDPEVKCKSFFNTEKCLYLQEESPEAYRIFNYQ